ncbi:MAG: ABC transporter ATP-binding protein [Dehalococcoidales bacterium]|nr:ABC transporter ATP-binding protein [Dehalococcoidales bacterium]
MLEINDVHTHYGDAHVLHGISLDVEEGYTTTILGRNGMGKTTTIRSIIGLTPPRRGSVRFKGREITNLQPHQIARLGIGLVAQGRHIFPSLSVKENLSVAARSRGKTGDWSLGRVYSLFPILKERANLKGNLLSGGEQQMLNIGRALMTNPQLLLMDEPSEGLAPLIIKEIEHVITELKREGLSILLAEQNLRLGLSMADYVYILDRGRIVYESVPEELENNEEIKAKYLGVTS